MQTIGEVDRFTLLCNSLTKLSKIERIASVQTHGMTYYSSISKEVIDNTRNILLKLIYQPSITPTTNDSIRLEYRNSDNAYLEFEVFVDRVKRCFYYNEVVYIQILDNINALNWMIINFLCENYSPIINECK